MAKPIKLLVGAIVLESYQLAGKPDVQTGWSYNPIVPSQKPPNHRRPAKPLRKSKVNRHG
jgi:hypothetical protein